MALKVAEKTKPDLILLDIMMPGIDGIETAKRLKANPITAEIPIVFVTAKTDVDTFIWDIGSDDGSTDTVYNFDSTYDILNLADILEGENSTAVSLDDYLDFNFVGGNTEISVDSDGAGGGGVTLTIVVNGVDLTNGGALATDIDIINSLLTDTALIVDTIP